MQSIDFILSLLYSAQTSVPDLAVSEKKKKELKTILTGLIIALHKDQTKFFWAAGADQVHSCTQEEAEVISQRVLNGIKLMDQALAMSPEEVEEISFMVREANRNATGIEN